MLDANVAGPGYLISRNGSYSFFEIDEQLLLLLVRLICSDRPLPFDEFVDGLLDYGLAPQDVAEGDALSASLERLGLLQRFSDSGEASFVHYE